MTLQYLPVTIPLSLCVWSLGGNPLSSIMAIATESQEYIGAQSNLGAPTHGLFDDAYDLGAKTFRENQAALGSLVGVGAALAVFWALRGKSVALAATEEVCGPSTGAFEALNAALGGAIRRELFPGVREFVVVSGNAKQLLKALDECETATGQLTLRELAHDGSRGPQLTAWVQHFGRGATLDAAKAGQADLVITCHPELYDNQALLAKHVFPAANGRVTLSLRSQLDFTAGRFDTVLTAMPPKPPAPIWMPEQYVAERLEEIRRSPIPFTIKFK